MEVLSLVHTFVGGCTLNMISGEGVEGVSWLLLLLCWMVLAGVGKTLLLWRVFAGESGPGEEKQCCQLGARWVRGVDLKKTATIDSSSNSRWELSEGVARTEHDPRSRWHCLQASNQLNRKAANRYRTHPALSSPLCLCDIFLAPSFQSATTR